MEPIGTIVKPVRKDVRSLPNAKASESPTQRKSIPLSLSSSKVTSVRVSGNYSGLASPAPLQNYLGVPDNGTAIPPDTMGTIGILHAVAMVNTEFQVRTKTTGGLVLSKSLNAFWGTSGAFDPCIQYDRRTNRFIACTVTGSATYLAVSATANPTLNWYIYAIPWGDSATSFTDFPRMGFSSTYITISVNIFNNDRSFRGVQIYTVDKGPTTAGQSLTIYSTFFPSSTGFFTMTPSVDTDGETTTVYLCQTGITGGGVDLLRVHRITLGLTPTLSFYRNYTIPASVSYSGVDNPQLGTSTRIDSGDCRVINCVYRTGKVWTSHNIYDGSGRSGCQVECFVPTQVTLTKVAIISDSTYTYSYPAVTVNAVGDALIGFSMFSPSIYASTGYSLWTKREVLPRTPYLYKAGQAPYTKDFGTGNVRWGDYSNGAPDPNVGNPTANIYVNSLWTIQEYASTGNNWACQWAMVRPPL